MSSLSDNARRTSASAAVGCSGKAPFDTYSLAVEVARSSRRKRKRHLGVYRCRDCSKFHVGNSLPPLRRPRFEEEE